MAGVFYSIPAALASAPQRASLETCADMRAVDDGSRYCVSLTANALGPPAPARGNPAMVAVVSK